MIDIARETLLSLPDAAKRLSVSHKTIRKWAAQQGHRLETAKFGGKVVTSLEALQRFGRQRGDDADGSSIPSAPRGGSPRSTATALAVADAERRLAALGVTA